MKQNIAIAEICGEDSDSIVREMIPSYTSDLKAMHEAEGFMNNSQKQRYVTLLFQLYKTADGERDVTGVAPGIGWYPVHASASQRAEAFLRVMGKWKDGE